MPMTPQERSSLCGQCRLAVCNETSTDCLIQIKGLRAEVGRESRTRMPAAFNHEDRQREAVLRRSVLELVAFKQIKPHTFAELMSYFKNEASKA